jgi:uncharacterized repeat protein (TIGR03803 family)
LGIQERNGEKNVTRMYSKVNGMPLALLVAIAAGMATMPSARAQQLTTLYSFCQQSGCPDGAYPYAGLVQGADGNFYGTTYQGGTSVACPAPAGCGTVFNITPAGVLTTLYNFCSQSGCTDGKLPYAGLILASDGNFYGTTYEGGNTNNNEEPGSGTVFKITPEGVLTTLYTFCSLQYCADGAGPYDSLVQGIDGNFYGTTSGGGGPYGLGTVFKITPDGALTTLYSFCTQSECTPIGDPQGGLVQAGDGNFYGTTGGTTGGTAYSAVFGITPSGALTYIYSFCQAGSPCPDGVHPTDTLTLGSDGNLYGTTLYGGANQQLGFEEPGGTVFSITTSGAHTVLYSFCGVGAYPACTDGADPAGGVIQASDGNFYGTTSEGGAYHSAGNATGGTIFKITPAGALTTLYSFCAQSNCPDGAYPQAGLIQASDENFYGTNPMGGVTSFCPGPSPGCGTIFTLAAAPIAGVSPTSLTFGNQDVGTTSASQPVTLSNTGPAPLAVSSIVPSGDFVETDNCNGSVAAGKSCTINVTFTPTATGTRNGTLTLTDNSNLVPGSQQTVSLTGTAINPGGTPSPTSLAFGSQLIQTASAMKKVTLTSTGTTNLMNVSITISGANSGDFTQVNNCPASMAPGAKCTIGVTFTPSLLSAESATLDINDNAAKSPQAVPLSGTGVPPATLTPTSASFGSVPEGIPSVAKNFTLKNNQPTALSISSIGFTGANAGDFSHAGTCGTSLAARASCTLSVTFTPSLIGAEAATLAVNDNAPTPYNTLTASLTGTGIAQASASPASLTFAAQKVGTTSAAKSVTLTNNLSTAITFSGVSFSGSDAGDFSSPSNTCGGSVAAKSHCTISVTFTPGATGTRTATLNANDGANNSPQTVALSGTGK